jgi:hypothetical protein
MIEEFSSLLDTSLLLPCDSAELWVVHGLQNDAN